MKERAIKYVRRGAVTASLLVGAAGVGHGISEYRASGRDSNFPQIAADLYKANDHLATETTVNRVAGDRIKATVVPKDPDTQSARVKLEEVTADMEESGLDTAGVESVISNLSEKPDADSYREEQAKLHNTAQSIAREHAGRGKKASDGVAIVVFSGIGSGVAALLSWAKIRERDKRKRTDASLRFAA